MAWYNLVVYAVFITIILLTVLGIVFTLLIPVVDKWNKRYLVVLFSFQFICMIICLMADIAYGNPDLISFEKAVVYFEFLFLTIIITMPSIFLSHYAGEEIKNGLLVKLSMVFAITHVAILTIGQFTDVIYYVTPNNEFIRGPLFPILMFPLLTILILDIIGVFVLRKRIAKGYFVAFLIYLPPLAVITLLHMFLSVEYLFVFAVGLWAATILIIVVNENSKEFLRQQQEIVNQKANILILQMRPHFIYNTMTSIYYLCDQDSKKAKQVTYDFTTYLRKNFAAIVSAEVIPFEDELEHAHAYLAVEQAQFEDSLFVDFDTPYTSFKLPPLTLQPIVENAVKHGMTSSNDPIHISVKTRKTENAIEIIVEDDGPGYKPKDDNEPHIALNNIRQRLEMMCKGKLEIFSGNKSGTKVKITIPYSK